MTIPLAVLAVGAVVSGWVGIPRLGQLDWNWFGHFLEPVVHAVGGHGEAHHASLGLELVLMALSVAVAGVGIFVAWRTLRWLQGLVGGTTVGRTIPGSASPAAQQVLRRRDLRCDGGARHLEATARHLFGSMPDSSTASGQRLAPRDRCDVVLSGFFDKYVVDGLVNFTGWFLQLGIASLSPSADRTGLPIRHGDGGGHVRAGLLLCRGCAAELVNEGTCSTGCTSSDSQHHLLPAPGRGADHHVLHEEGPTSRDPAASPPGGRRRLRGFGAALVRLRPSGRAVPVSRERELDRGCGRALRVRCRRHRRLVGADDDLSRVLRFLSSWSAIQVREKEYYIFMLLLQTGMMGVFMAMDFFLFYVFWEVMLVPMYFLIGIWGGPRKLYAAIKFFLYTLVGSVLMLLGILALYFYNSSWPARLGGLGNPRASSFRSSTRSRRRFRPSCSSGSSSSSLSASPSRCRCSRSTPGCPTLTSRLRRPARSFWPVCC